MLLKEKLLRRYVRHILVESGLADKIAAKMEKAKSQQLAIFKKSVNLGSPGFILGLYRPNVFVGHVLASLSDDLSTYDTDLIQQGVDKSIVGIIGMRQALDPSYGALEVTNSASTMGYGPMLHDVAMAYSPTGAIIPDRNAVSKEESNLYKSYRDGRPDVEKMQLDDKEDPKTPPKVDDSKVWHDGRDHLNFAFKKKNAVDVKDLEKNHEDAMRTIEKRMNKLGWDSDTIDDILQTASADFFNRIYADVKAEDR